MKAVKFTLAAFLALASSLCCAQTLVERPYIMRTDSTRFDPYSGITHTCVLLYTDGRRLERSFQSNHVEDPEVRVYVYLDILPESDVKAFQTVLDDTQFQQIRTAPPHGGIVVNLDTLSITVPREHSVQNINFNNAAERHPYDKTLKPFLASLRSLEKRKVAVAKNEKSDNRNPPQILYHSTFAPGTNPPADPQQ